MKCGASAVRIMCKRRTGISFSNRTWLRPSFIGSRGNGRRVYSAILPLWGWITRPDANARARYLDTTRMLNEAELCALFPEAEIWPERVLGLTKSFVAAKRSALSS